MLNEDAAIEIQETLNSLDESAIQPIINQIPGEWDFSIERQNQLSSFILQRAKYVASTGQVKGFVGQLCEVIRGTVDDRLQCS
jgi:uncharacterized phage protein gp47/JayE